MLEPGCNAIKRMPHQCHVLRAGIMQQAVKAKAEMSEKNAVSVASLHEIGRDALRYRLINLNQAITVNCAEQAAYGGSGRLGDMKIIKHQRDGRGRERIKARIGDVIFQDRELITSRNVFSKPSYSAASR